MYSNLKICIVDFNFALLAKDLIVVNECSILDYNNNVGNTYHISCSKSLQNIIQNYYLYQCSFNTKKIHKIPLNYGSLPYSILCKILKHHLSAFHFILTKGDQKVDILNTILPRHSSVIDLTHLGCPRIDILFNRIHAFQTSCTLHSGDFRMCTAYKSLVYADWIKTQYPVVYQLLLRRLSEM
jgi:hypothetical protein